MSEPYLRWHPVTGGYVGKAELCVIASRAPDSDCYTELNRLTMERIHEEALEENLCRSGVNGSRAELRFKILCLKR